MLLNATYYYYYYYYRQRFYANCFAFHLAGTGNNTMLREVSVGLFTNEKCNHRKWYRGRVTDLMVCAGHAGGGKDACQEID